MAHATTLSQLANGLITSIVPHNGDPAIARQLHDRTLRGLKNTSHARTNQFDVQSKLAGLVEKFAVLNRDDLADGLQTRLDELPFTSKWLPEILSLLLELSDRPLEKTRQEDVEAASKVEGEQPALTWAEIIADEPLDEAGIWDDVERGYHSSDDDFTADDDGSGDETQATSVAEEDFVMLARMHILRTDDEPLDSINDLHQRVERLGSEQAASELFLIRESLSMLHGLPTSIYGMSEGVGSITFLRSCKLDTASETILTHALQTLADTGSSLNLLRAWTKTAQALPTLRACQAAIASALQNLASGLAGIEQRYLTPTNNGGVTSIVHLRADIERLAQPFRALANAVQMHGSDASSASIALLDRLYNAACISQLSGDSSSFEVVTGVLLAGLNAYLRPVANWITAGECNASSDFFVEDGNSACELGRLWHERYALKQSTDGAVAAPTFLQPCVHGIFALGKGRAFLKALAQSEEEPDFDRFASRSLVLDTDCNDLLPFSQVLADALETWIAEQSRDQTPLLRQSILETHGLLSTVDALQEVYFSKNGRRFQTFADTLFWRLDYGARWADAFLLTELAQSTLGSGRSVIAESLTVQISKREHETGASESSIRRLSTIHLRYHLPWPQQNVTASPSSDSCSKAFTLLLQIYRAKYLLRHHVFSLRRSPDRSRTPRIQRAVKLHQRLSTTIDILHAHVTYTSALLSGALKHDLREAGDLDAMASSWTSHEKNLETSLLVAEKVKPIREAVIGLLELCERVMELLTPPANLEERSDSGELDNVAQMEREAERSLAFVTAGLRGIGRAGGNAALEMLAERLEWAVH